MSETNIGQRTGKRHSVSARISASMIGVLLPSLVLLILVSCIMASSSISALNDKILEAQTSNAISTVDGFFSNKVTAVGMYQEDSDLQNFFMQVVRREQIEQYAGLDGIVSDLSAALERMSSENVEEVWVASPNTDMYVLSSGRLVEAGLASTEWASTVINEKKVVITDPFVNPDSGKQVISIVTPVMSRDGKQTVGLMGMDVSMDSLSQILSSIKIGEEGYMEFLSTGSEYIYSEDPTAIGKNVDSLDINDDYKNKVKSKYEGIIDFKYAGISYTALSQRSPVTGWLAIATIPMNEVNATRNQLVLALAALSVVILIVLVLIIIMIIRKTMKPLADISENVQEFANGRLDVDVKIHSDDEIGGLADSVRLAIRNQKDIISDISQILKEISGGNLDVTVRGNYVGDFSPIRTALEDIIHSLNTTLGQISQSSDQVASGSEQVSSGGSGALTGRYGAGLLYRGACGYHQ